MLTMFMLLRCAAVVGGCCNHTKWNFGRFKYTYLFKSKINSTYYQCFKEMLQINTSNKSLVLSKQLANTANATKLLI